MHKQELSNFFEIGELSFKHIAISFSISLFAIVAICILYFSTVLTKSGQIISHNTLRVNEYSSDEELEKSYDLLQISQEQALNNTDFLTMTQNFKEYNNETLPLIDLSQDFTDCDCKCMNAKGSYEYEEGEHEHQYDLEALFTYDQEFTEDSFKEKFRKTTISLSPFHTRIQFKYGDKLMSFYQNMICSEIQKKDSRTNQLATFTTWSIDKDQVSNMNKILTQRIEAFTHGKKDGSDSRNWFFNEWLQQGGTFNNDNFNLQVYMAQNHHELIKNGVLPSGTLPQELGFQKVLINQANYKPISFTQKNRTLLNFNQGAQKYIMYSIEQNQNGFNEDHLKKFSKNEKVVLETNLYNIFPSFWYNISPSFLDKTKDNKPKVYKTLELAKNIESPSNELIFEKINHPYLTKNGGNLETITLLSKADDGYKNELMNYESKIELVYDSSSYKNHVISYYDLDYMSTKIGSLLSLYDSTVGWAISFIFLMMLKGEMIMKFILNSNKEDDSPQQMNERIEQAKKRFKEFFKMENQIKSYDAVKKHSEEIMELKLALEQQKEKLSKQESQIINQNQKQIKQDETINKLEHMILDLQKKLN